MAILSVKDVSKYYGDHCALNNVSLEIPKGSIYGLLGPNGAGKTSLIRIINQITAPDSGSVSINGETLNPSHISNIGYLPEERGLYPKMKVGEQLLYLARLKNLSKAQALKHIKEWMNRFEITDWWNKNIEELSKGMAQKVQFIATVIHQPQLLIFDEPFTGFDPINTNLIKSEILRLRDEGATVIFSTHRMESVEEICDEISLINKSQKILDGSIKDIKKAYKSNIFLLELATQNNEVNLPEYAKLIEQQTTSNNTLLLKVSLEETQVNTLLKDILQQATLVSFNEEIPSLNDIFIQKVQQL